MDIDRLHVDELDYELAVCGISCQGSVADKRKLLRATLKMVEAGNLTAPELDLNAEEECQTCEDKLILLQAEVRICRSTTKDNEYKRLCARLTHVRGRLARIPDTVEGKEELVAMLALIFQELEHKISASPRAAAATSPAGADLISFEDPAPASVAFDPVLTPPQVRFGEQPELGDDPELLVHTDFPRSRRSTLLSSTAAAFPPVPLPAARGGNYLAINKWNLCYDGASGLASFLERVEELRTARGITKGQLFAAAVEFFSGNALIWYRSVRSQVRNWDELVAALRQAFLPCDYEASLWDEIRTRTQGPDEPVAVYIAIMENLFRRLSSVPLETTRMQIIRRNLQPYLQSQLALQFITSVGELIRLCKTVEDAQVRSARFRHPSSNWKNVLEPDLAYRKATSTFKIGVIGNEPSPVASTSTQAIEATSPLTCWNCSQSGHRSAQCPAPKRLHCYSCGTPNVTVHTCPRCSGNGRRGQ